MVGWPHEINGHEFEQALGDGEGQGSLVCCSPWGHKELDSTERLNNNNNNNNTGKRATTNPLPWKLRKSCFTVKLKCRQLKK